MSNVLSRFFVSKNATKREFRNLASVKALFSSKKLNILLLADDRHEANVVQDHINSFRLYSKHNVFVVNPIWQKIDRCCQLNDIDVILIHYSILIVSDYFLPKYNANIIRDFKGEKAQIIQDEYRWVNKMKAKMHELGVSAVFSSLNVENLKKVYGGDLLNNVNFYSCLPGYIPQHMINADVLPIKERPLDIVYRGRELPFWFGKQAREKSQIGEHMLRICGQYGGLIDIATSETSRIYGEDWIKFISSGRTTLGVEGGVSIFDFDEKAESGTKAYLEKHPDAKFDEVFENVLKPFEENIVHRTITPRIFEAILLKTALILYPGNYRQILKADENYILLEPDGSNNEEVAKKIKDHAYLQDMVDRTYKKIVNNKKLQASFYVKQIDKVLSNLEN